MDKLSGSIILLALLLLTGLTISSSVHTLHAEDDMENALRERVAGLYEAYKQRNFKKFFSYTVFECDEAEVERRISEMSIVYPKVIDYRIEAISIFGNKARVNVTMTLISDNRKEFFNSYDHWIFLNNDWRLSSFAKIL